MKKRTRSDGEVFERLEKLEKAQKEMGEVIDNLERALLSLIGGVEAARATLGLIEPDKTGEGF